MSVEVPEIVGLPDRLPMTLALVDLLAQVTGKPWEIGRIPTKPNPKKPTEQIAVTSEFGILYPQWRTVTGPVRKPNIRWVYQATMSVKRADQLEVFDDRIQGALIGRKADMNWAYPLVVPGIHVIDREITDTNSGDTTTDTTTEMPTRDVRFAISVNAHEETP